MKTHLQSVRRWPLRPLFTFVLAVALFGFSTRSIRAQVNQLEVDVRTLIKDKPSGKPLPEGKGNHSKIYGILSVQLIPSEQRMVKPVDAHRLLEQVRHELGLRGFQEVTKGSKPEILVTIQYGRSYTRNPYFGDSVPTEDASGRGPQFLGMDNAPLLMRLSEAGVEMKAQRADYEKLCIKVTAWQYPTDRKARAKELWSALMVVDDPDHRDLNEIAAKMLEAGSPYFDRELKGEEVTVTKPLPDGHVNVGAPEVVEHSRTK